MSELEQSPVTTYPPVMDPIIVKDTLFGIDKKIAIALIVVLILAIIGSIIASIVRKIQHVSESHYMIEEGKKYVRIPELLWPITSQSISGIHTTRVSLGPTTIDTLYSDIEYNNTYIE